jgi:hypothetical protein
MSVLPCDDECEVISIQAEQDTGIKVEEIPKPRSFTEIKVEPDVVSYMSVCHQYIEMVRLFSGLCYVVVSKMLWTDTVKIIKLTIRPIGRHHP